MLSRSLRKLEQAVVLRGRAPPSVGCGRCDCELWRTVNGFHEVGIQQCRVRMQRKNSRSLAFLVLVQDWPACAQHPKPLASSRSKALIFEGPAQVPPGSGQQQALLTCTFPRFCTFSVFSQRMPDTVFDVEKFNQLKRPIPPRRAT